MELKSKFVELASDDNKAKAHFLDSLSICAHNHILSRKLFDRYASTTGPMFAIVGEWFDLARLTSYDEYVMGPEGEFTIGERPVERLVAFVGEYMKTTKGAVVLCENWCAERGDIAKWWWAPLRVACYGDKDVYHVLSPEIVDPNLIESAVATSHHWQTAVCSLCSHVPEGDIPSEAFLDHIVVNAKYIFIPAFDDTGFLVWSPMGN